MLVVPQITKPSRGKKRAKNLTLKTRNHKAKQTKMTKTNPFPNFRSPGR